MQRTASAKTTHPPVWWNTHGDKLVIGETNNMLTGPHADLCIRSGMIAEVRINQIYRRPLYILDWKVQHVGGLEFAHTGGHLAFNPTELRQMFGLDDTTADPLSQWLIEQYGGTVASQGKFIRWGRYLNISGPGTGHDGDANISILVSPEIQKAVEQLLQEKGHLQAA